LIRSDLRQIDTCKRNKTPGESEKADTYAFQT
jgi:hypothetical protein